jgi:hypothetical protein
MAVLNLFPARVAFVNNDGTLTTEAYRALNVLFNRVGGSLGDNGVDVFGDISSISSVSNPSDIETIYQTNLQDVQLQNIEQPSITQDSHFEVRQGEFNQFIYPDIQQPLVDKSGAPPVPVTVTASPFSYTADRDGFLVVQGGTVTKQEYGRTGTFTDVGLLNSMLPILLGDIIRVTYTVAPTITFIPR